MEMLKNLIDKKVSISVGEPWDFVSHAGKNILEGAINLVSDENETEWLKCKVSPFSIKKNTIRIIIAVNRYTNQSFKSLLNGEKITSNFLYESTGKDLNPDQISKIIKEQTGVNFLVGSVQLIREKRANNVKFV